MQFWFKKKDYAIARFTSCEIKHDAYHFALTGARCLNNLIPPPLICSKEFALAHRRVPESLGLRVVRTLSEMTPVGRQSPPRTLLSRRRSALLRPYRPIVCAGAQYVGR